MSSTSIVLTRVLLEPWGPRLHVKRAHSLPQWRGSPLPLSWGNGLSHSWRRLHCASAVRPGLPSPFQAQGCHRPAPSWGPSWSSASDHTHSCMQKLRKLQTIMNISSEQCKENVISMHIFCCIPKGDVGGTARRQWELVKDEHTKRWRSI